jgi:hypothetical protein
MPVANKNNMTQHPAIQDAARLNATKSRLETILDPPLLQNARLFFQRVIQIWQRPARETSARYWPLSISLLAML